MVYCTKCGFRNKDDAKICTQCKAPLEISPLRRSGNACFGKREGEHDECFGLPNAGSIVGLIFGVIIVLFGLAIVAGFEIWDYIWPVIITIIGLLFIAGALYRMRQS